MKLSIVILSIFFVNVLLAGDPGLRRYRYALHENLQKTQLIDYSKIESLQPGGDLFNLSKAEIESKMSYSLSKKYDLLDQKLRISYVVVLKVFEDPASVNFYYEDDKVKSITIYFGRKNKFDDVLPRLESLYGKSNKTEQKKYSKHIYWENKNVIAVLNQLSSENLTTLDLKK